MEEAVRFNATKPASIDRETQSLSRCEHALELLLTHRGNPSAEIDRVLADDPQCVFGHCLRAALIVRADAAAARSTLAASVAAIEAACPDTDDPARRHAAAARAWLEGDPALAAERYGAIVIDWPHDILALVVAHALDFRLGRRRMMRDRIAQVLPEWDDRDARLRERPCDVRVRRSRRTASIVVPKRWRGARSPSIPDIRAPFTSSPM